MALVLLSRTMLDIMMADPRFADVSCLTDPPRFAVDPDPPRRSCCGQQAQHEAPPQPPIDYNELKLRIVAAPAEEKAKIRQLLDSECIVLQYKLPSGMVLKDEF